MRDQTNEAVDAVVKMSPPAVVSFYASVLDRPIEFWVGVLTIIYMAIQIFLLVRDRVVRRRRAADEIDEAGK